MEEGIESERHTLQLMNERDEIANALRDAKRNRELEEKAYEAAKKYVSLRLGAALAEEISAAKFMQLELQKRLGSDDRVEGEGSDESSLRDTERQPSILETSRTNSISATRAVVDVQALIVKERKITMKLRTDLNEQMKLETSCKEKLQGCKTEAASWEQEQSLILEVRYRVCSSYPCSDPAYLTFTF